MLNKISEVSKKIEKGLRYGHPCCDDEALIVLLLNTAKISCYNKKEARIYDDIIKNLDFSCQPLLSKVIVTDNGKEAWETANPACISRKQWERIALKICLQYKLDFIIDKIDKACDVAFDITKNVIDCEVLTSISIQNKMCELNITVDRNPAKCAAEYKLLIEQYPDCNLTKKEYIYLLDTNYSFEIISSVYNKHLHLEVDPYGNTFLVSPLNKYSLDDELKFKEIIVNSETKDLVLTRRIINDYNITNIQKQKILNELSII